MSTCDGAAALLVPRLADRDRLMRQNATASLIRLGPAAIDAVVPLLAETKPGFVNPHRRSPLAAAVGDESGLEGDRYFGDSMGYGESESSETAGDDGSTSGNEPGSQSIPLFLPRPSDYAAIALISIGADSAHAVAIEGASHREAWPTARAVLRLLGVEALPELVVLLRSRDPNHRLFAADVLQRMSQRNETVCAALIPLLGDRYEATQSVASMALIRCPGASTAILRAGFTAAPNVVSHFARALSEAVQQRKSEATEMLAAFPAQPSGVETRDVFAARSVCNLRDLGPAVLPLLKSYLASPHAAVREEAARSMQCFPERLRPVDELLCLAAEDPEQKVRWEAFQAIGRGDPRGAAIALHRIETKPPTFELLRALDQLGSRELAVAVAAAIVRDRNRAGAAMKFLEGFYYDVSGQQVPPPHVPERTMPPYVEPSQEGTIDYGVWSENRIDRERAMWRLIPLMRQEDQVAIETVAMLLRDEDLAIRARALYALAHGAECSAPAAAEIRRAISDDNSLSPLGAMTQMLLGTDDQFDRDRVARALDSGSGYFYRGHRVELGKGEPHVAAISVSLVEMFSRVARARPGVIAPFLSKPGEAVRTNTLRALLMATSDEFGERDVINRDRLPTAIVPQVAAVLDDSHVNVRLLAIGVLAATGRRGHAAIPVLTRHLTDDDGEVRMECSALLDQLDVGRTSPVAEAVADERRIDDFIARMLEVVMARIRPEPPPSGGAKSKRPSFPFRPPRASASMDVCWSLLGSASDKFGDVHRRMSAGLFNLGYGDQRTFVFNDGFAIATLFERVDAMGHPNLSARWTRNRLTPRNWSEYVNALLFDPPGHFRFFMFVVSRDGVRPGPVQPSMSDVDETLLNADPNLPARVAALPYAHASVQLYVYWYEHESHEKTSHLLATSPPGLKDDLGTSLLGDGMNIRAVAVCPAR